MKKVIFALVAAFALQTAVAQTTGTFTDPRDGRTYKTMSYENFLLGTNVVWMAENLDYKTSEGCWAYDNNEQYRKRLGLLYTYDAALKVCPVGWHLPTDNEWDALVNQFGGAESAGTALKATQGWNQNGNGDNSSGFNALPGGCRYADGSFNYAGQGGFWWSSTPNGDEVAWKRYLGYDDGKVSRSSGNRQNGFSVRCAKD